VEERSATESGIATDICEYHSKAEAQAVLGCLERLPRQREIRIPLGRLAEGDIDRYPQLIEDCLSLCLCHASRIGSPHLYTGR
jgi:hypothetical protein